MSLDSGRGEQHNQLRCQVAWIRGSLAASRVTFDPASPAASSRTVTGTGYAPSRGFASCSGWLLYYQPAVLLVTAATFLGSATTTWVFRELER